MGKSIENSETNSYMEKDSAYDVTVIFNQWGKGRLFHEWHWDKLPKHAEKVFFILTFKQYQNLKENE